MPSFGKESTKQLKTCHPKLRILFNEVVKNYNCTVLQGHRSEDEQNEYYRTGRSKLKYPESKHNHLPSLAVDVVPYFKNPPHIRWNDRIKFYHFAGYVKGISDRLHIQIRFGGNWDMDDELHDQIFMDLSHFELH